jgi:hypothetical protein
MAGHGMHCYVYFCKLIVFFDQPILRQDIHKGVSSYCLYFAASFEPTKPEFSFQVTRTFAGELDTA